MNAKQEDTEEPLCEISTKGMNIQRNLRAVKQIKSDAERLMVSNDENAAVIKKLRHSLDDLENRGRRNILIFFGFSNSVSEPKNGHESKVISLIPESLQLSVDLSAIGCEHRLGQFHERKGNTIIAPFSCF